MSGRCRAAGDRHHGRDHRGFAGQSAGIEQVNQTVTQMDETTQQNAALVEESTAAARSLEDQAEQLARAVAVFRPGRRDDVAGQGRGGRTAEAA
jgi:hypothetical protein